MTKSIFLLSGLAISLAFISCEKDKASLSIPSTYDASSYAANTSAETVLRNALANLSTEMKKGRMQGVTVNFAALSALYDASLPSLASVTSDYYKSRIVGTGGWLNELAKASGNDYTPGVPQGEGGYYSGYLFDENGLELGESVEKGLFGAAHYNHAITLLKSSFTPALADQLVCIFGAHPDFPNTDNAGKVANPDRFTAQYAARRDKNDGAGLYSQMKNALLKLQAAKKAGDDYRTEQQEAAAAVQETWERVIFATVINYCHATISKLSNTNPTDADKASGLHACGEAVGFVHGWRTLPQAYRKITDAQIEEILTLLNAPYDNTPTSYKFVTDPVNELPKLTQVIAKLQSIYGFTNQEIEDFKENWVAKQGR